MSERAGGPGARAGGVALSSAPDERHDPVLVLENPRLIRLNAFLVGENPFLIREN
jgi:hypothetical protein